jgi:branched-chain amino acid transport system substrate-binding protein
MSISGRRPPVVSRRWAALLLVPALGVLGACGSSATSASGGGDGAAAVATGGAGGGSGLPASLQLPAIEDLTGPAGFAGLYTQQGQRVAIDQINSTHFLGNTTLSLKYSDTQSTPQVAAEEASSAVNSSAPLAFGPVESTVSLAVAPVVERGKLPTVFTQSSDAGVTEGGDYTYVVTAPYQDLIDQTLGAYLKAKGIKSLGIISTTDNPGSVLVTQVLVAFCNQNGIKTYVAGDVPQTTTDFTAIASKTISAKPAAVFTLLYGTETVSLIRQLRSDGYAGPIVGTESMAGGVLTPLGSAANGIVYFTDYTAGLPGAVNKTFTSLFAKMYGGGLPSDYAAEGYDAVWLAARALKLADSTDRTKVLAALQSVAATGFEGAAGDITFKDRIEQGPFLLVKWENGKEVLLTAP